jgi:hypothetical protein
MNKDNNIIEDIIMNRDVTGGIADRINKERI